MNVRRISALHQLEWAIDDEDFSGEEVFLILSGKKLGDKGAIQLAEALQRFPADVPICIELFGCEIGYHGAKALSVVLQADRLNIIAFNFNDVNISPRVVNIISKSIAGNTTIKAVGWMGEYPCNYEYNELIEAYIARNTLLRRFPQQAYHIKQAAFECGLYEPNPTQEKQFRSVVDRFGLQEWRNVRAWKYKAFSKVPCIDDMINFASENVFDQGGVVTFDLQNKNLSDSDVFELLEMLQTEACIQSGMALKLAHNNIGVQGAKALAGVLQANQLNIVELDVEYNPLGDEGVIMMTDALKANTTTMNEICFGGSFDYYLLANIMSHIYVLRNKCLRDRPEDVDVILRVCRDMDLYEPSENPSQFSKKPSGCFKFIYDALTYDEAAEERRYDKYHKKFYDLWLLIQPGDKIRSHRPVLDNRL